MVSRSRRSSPNASLRAQGVYDLSLGPLKASQSPQSTGRASVPVAKHVSSASWQAPRAQAPSEAPHSPGLLLGEVSRAVPLPAPLHGSHRDSDSKREQTLWDRHHGTLMPLPTVFLSRRDCGWPVEWLEVGLEAHPWKFQEGATVAGGRGL